MQDECGTLEQAAARSARRRLLDFGVDVERLDGGTYVVGVEGELDAYSAPRLEQALGRVLADDATGVVVDLSRCSFIDSTGLRVLVGTSKRLISSVRPLVLVSSDRNLERLLEVTGLAAVFETHPTRAGALANGRG